jgi:hypothetical protein
LEKEFNLSATLFLPEEEAGSLQVFAFPPEGGAVHLEGGGEVGGLVVEVAEEMTEEVGLEGAGEVVVGGEVVGGGGELVIDPAGEGGVELGLEAAVAGGGGVGAGDALGQMAREDEGGGADGGGVLHGVLQLPDLSGPEMGLQAGEGLGAEAELSGALSGATEEIAGESGNVLGSLRERRDSDLDDLQSVIQVLAEPTLADLG